MIEKDVEKKLSELENKLSFLEGLFKYTKITFLFTFAAILAFFGYTKFETIPDEVEKQIAAEAAGKVQEQLQSYASDAERLVKVLEKNANQLSNFEISKRPILANSESTAYSVNFDFPAKHAWIEVVDNIERLEQAEITGNSGGNNVEAIIKLTPVARENINNNARVNVWAISY